MTDPSHVAVSFHVSLGDVLEKRCPILVLALLHPVSVYLERSRVYELADDLDAVRVLFDNRHLEIRLDTIRFILGQRYCVPQVQHVHSIQGKITDE